MINTNFHSCPPWLRMGDIWKERKALNVEIKQVTNIFLETRSRNIQNVLSFIRLRGKVADWIVTAPVRLVFLAMKIFFPNRYENFRSFSKGFGDLDICKEAMIREDVQLEEDSKFKALRLEVARCNLPLINGEVQQVTSLKDFLEEGVDLEVRDAYFKKLGFSEQQIRVIVKAGKDDEEEPYRIFYTKGVYHLLKKEFEKKFSDRAEQFAMRVLGALSLNRFYEAILGELQEKGMWTGTEFFVWRVNVVTTSDDPYVEYKVTNVKQEGGGWRVNGKPKQGEKTWFGTGKLYLYDWRIEREFEF